MTIDYMIVFLYNVLMANILFGIDISRIIHDATRGQLLPAVLIKVSQTSFDPNNPGAGPVSVETPYKAEGIIDSYDDSSIDGTVIRSGDRRITLIGNSIESMQIPESGDKITIEGYTLTIVRVSRDPSAATYQCQVR